MPPFHLLMPPPIPAQVDQDADEPRLFAPQRNLSGRTGNPHEGVLHKIASLFSSGDHAAGEAEQSGVMCVKQGREAVI
jgi:hypothetical protein